MSELCPCGSNQNYDQCCQIYHQDNSVAKTAESLMRARYSAFAKGEIDFIVNSFEPVARKEQDKQEIEIWANESKWLGLTILNCENGLENDEEGTVEFSANYIMNGKNCKHHELSTFKKIDGLWYFCDGQIINSSLKREGPKVGRNDPCPCGSGKKFKKCCLT